MDNDKLYADYGRAMIELEIAQLRVNQIKQQLVEALNRPPVEKKENEQNK